MALTLAGLSDEELADRRPAMIEGFAREVAAHFGQPLDQAVADAERELTEALSQGVRTEGQLLLKAVDDGAEVGFLWVSLPGTTYPTMAWISDIEVAAGQRSKGYGSAMIAAAEADLVARGVRRIGLHVFGTNAGARRLYDRLGYRVLAQARARAIEPSGSVPALAPMTATEYDDRIAALLRDDPIALVRDPDAAPDKARQLLDRLAPDGPSTEGVFFRTTPGGWIWYSLPHPQRSTMGMIHYLAVDPDRRRRGLGRAMVAAAEAEMARHGVARATLNVAGSNEAALALADRLGYQVLSQQMIKDL
jgi:mycothiol synthase